MINQLEKLLLEPILSVNILMDLNVTYMLKTSSNHSTTVMESNRLAFLRVCPRDTVHKIVFR